MNDRHLRPLLDAKFYKTGHLRGSLTRCALLDQAERAGAHYQMSTSATNASLSQILDLILGIWVVGINQHDN